MSNMKVETKNIPARPGVYLFKDKSGRVIYVGKAKILRQRVRSYFAELPKDDFKTKNLTANISSLDYIITDSELEALILENSLIKKHKPKYNIRMRDDKDYQFIK